MAPPPPSPGERRSPSGWTEQAVLRASIIVTVLVAAAGVGMGLIAGSAAIVFDGVYGLIDAVMTVLALLVTRLIAASNAADAVGRNYSRRFTMGFWHLEPIVLGLNGMLLTGAALYAMLDAIGAILAGGHPLSFGAAAGYAGMSFLADLGMACIVFRCNRSIRSAFLALDARSWMLTAALSGSLLVSFLIGGFVEGGTYGWLRPYIDPAALLAICVVIVPVPIATVRTALSQILLVTPEDLLVRVEAIADRFVASEGFSSHHAFVARVGRGTQIELNFVVAKREPPRRLEDWDALRDAIGHALGGDDPDLWLTIVFTTDPEWAW